MKDFILPSFPAKYGVHSPMPLSEGAVLELYKGPIFRVSVVRLFNWKNTCELLLSSSRQLHQRWGLKWQKDRPYVFFDLGQKWQAFKYI